MAKGLVVVLFFVCSLGISVQFGYAQTHVAEKIYNQVSKSIYTVKSVNFEKQEVSQGSAVAITSDLLATNCHVALAGNIFLVYIDHKGKAGYLFYNYRDLCIIAVPNGRFNPVQIRASNEVRTGEDVYAIGNPHPNKEDRDGDLPIHIFLSQPRFDAYISAEGYQKLLISLLPKDLYTENHNFMTPMRLAKKHNNELAIKLFTELMDKEDMELEEWIDHLVEFHADPNEPVDKKGYLLLHLLVSHNKLFNSMAPEIYIQLLEAFLPTQENIKHFAHHTAMTLARKHGNGPALLFFMNRGMAFGLSDFDVMQKYFEDLKNSKLALKMENYSSLITPQQKLAAANVTPFVNKNRSITVMI